jgi:hypothetical protein
MYIVTCTILYPFYSAPLPSANLHSITHTRCAKDPLQKSNIPARKSVDEASGADRRLGRTPEYEMSRRGKLGCNEKGKDEELSKGQRMNIQR